MQPLLRRGPFTEKCRRPSCAGFGGFCRRFPHWAPDTNAPVGDLNLNLCHLRNIDIQMAEKYDVRLRMCSGRCSPKVCREKGIWSGLALSGKDGVHPGWAGHVVMAYAFLKAMGLDGGIGTFTVDMAADQASVSDGHTLDSFTNNTLTITSRRYPFCATGPQTAIIPSGSG